jgi:hypothetical protein
MAGDGSLSAFLDFRKTTSTRSSAPSFLYHLGYIRHDGASRARPSGHALFVGSSDSQSRSLGFNINLRKNPTPEEEMGSLWTIVSGALASNEGDPMRPG